MNELYENSKKWKEMKQRNNLWSNNGIRNVELGSNGKPKEGEK